MSIDVSFVQYFSGFFRHFYIIFISKSNEDIVSGNTLSDFVYFEQSLFNTPVFCKEITRRKFQAGYFE